MVTDEMMKRAIEAYAKDTGAEGFQLEGWIEPAIRAALEAALSAAEPQPAPSVAVKAIEAVWKYSLVIESSVRRGDGPDQYAGVTEALRLVKEARSALSAQVQDVTEGWHVASNSGSVLVYCLKQDGWRKGEPVMVNDIMIRVENANRSSNELQPIVDAIMRALPAAPAKQEG